MRTGAVESGDVTLFYRQFGPPGAVPVLILHGANYFDSADWIPVARALATGREVVAFDQRGFGESTWSPGRNYSNDAHIGDVLCLLEHFGWPRVVLMGHSRGGQHATLFASRFAERTAGLILVDYCPGGGPPAATPAATAPVAASARAAGSLGNIQSPGGTRPRVFPSVEALQATLSRDPNAPPGSAARARLESFLRAVEGGFILGKRDPDFASPAPVGVPGWTPEYNITDSWQELSAVRAPILVVRGSRSDRFPSAGFGRLRDEYSHATLVEVDAGHDIAAAAPGPLVEAINPFLARLDEVAH